MGSVNRHVNTQRMAWFWVDEWCGDKVRSRLFVELFKSELKRDDMFAGTPETFFMRDLISGDKSEKCWIVCDTGHQSAQRSCTHG